MQTETSGQPGSAAVDPGALRIGYGVYARPRKPRWQRWLRILLVVLLIVVAVLATQLAAGLSGADDLLMVHIENQQPINIDLRTSTARSPYVFGVNVFPAAGTQAADGSYGFMPYGPHTIQGLIGAGITMLRFPGGTWGEAHTVSYQQVNAFLHLAQQVHAAPLIQVRLRGSTPAAAAALVSYCNNPHNPIRQQYPNAPFLPVHYWAIGNEPDQRGPDYTVADYVHDFIAFATAMKVADPTIQIFGPELSQYNGPDAPPFDAHGTPWLTGFLQGVLAFERAHNWQILDGVSLHRYPFVANIDSTSLLFATADEWRYALPLLRKQIHQVMGTDLPIAITEINTSALGGQIASPLATALWWANTLGILLEEHVNYVDFFAARGVSHPYALLTMAGDPTPLYRVMQLYTHMAPDVIPVDSGDNVVSLYAATDAAHDTVTLMLINKSALEAAVTVSPVQRFSAWHTARLRLPPYAAACMVLYRGGGGQVFLYAPPAQALATGQAGPITMEPLPK
jgi:hypothetical protein